MPGSPVLLIVLPALGAAGVAGLTLLSRFARPYSRYAAQTVALLASGCTLVLLLVFRWREPVTTIPSLWQPSLLFGSTLALQLDASVYPVALALALITFSSMLVALGRGIEGLPSADAMMLGLLGLALFSLCSGNVLTLLVGWTLYDVLLVVGQVAAGRPPREAVRRLLLGSVATMLLWAGALVSGDGASGRLWPLMPLSDARAALWALAGLLRVWAYPFHLASPDSLGSAPAAAPLYVGPLLGWGLWIRMASVNGGAVASYNWVLTAAVFTMTVGAFLAWSCEDVRRVLPWAGVSVSGGVLLAGLAAGQRAAPIIASGAVAWALAMTVLLMCAGLARAGMQRNHLWWGIPAWVGAATLVGLPLTLGFVTTALLVGGLVGGGSVGGGIAFFVAQALLIPALVRWLMLPPQSLPPARLRSRLIWLTGLGLPVAALALMGVFRATAIGGLEVPSLGQLFLVPTLPGWLLWAVSLAIAGLLTWQEPKLRSRAGHILGLGHDLWRLEWLYGATAGALERGLSLVRAADDLVGGTGALLWSTVLFLILVLVWGA